MSRDTLISMFNKADIERNGYINKKQLLDCIKDDIINGHQEYVKDIDDNESGNVNDNNFAINNGELNSCKSEAYQTRLSISDPYTDPVLKLIGSESAVSGNAI